MLNAQLNDAAWGEVEQVLAQMVTAAARDGSAVLPQYLWVLLDLDPGRTVRIGSAPADAKPIPLPVRERVDHLVHVLRAKENGGPRGPR
ncbi:hypothetical protein ADK67_31850 [Saccharothrix sp. NRRL B-16348]|uniref:CATRA system-associated protein n=1 Tax=Saccharothrix sp. NRRL B-16348 TaxID=1415542 RepID=UPI0006AE42FB|nr:CATRA system-associated protein [Saccharothrix sp. NRRL B-16348]KOX20112.1 hypothetical protein ADK67_31850 [Saccharothrix sp. NRRL B-16348]